MKAVNFFMKFVSVLFIIAFGLLCIIATVFLLVRNMTSQDNITNYVNSANIFDYSANEVLSNDKSNTLRETIKKKLLALEISPLVVDEVIDSKELDKLISNYIYDYLQYLIHNTNKPTFPSQNILGILIEKNYSQEGKSLSENQKEKVLNYIKLLGDKVDQGLLDQSEVDEMVSLNIAKKAAAVFDSKLTPMVIGIIIVIMIAIISICLRSIKKAVNWCSKAAILDGIILIIASFVEVRLLIMYFNSQGLIDSLAISIIENGFENTLVYGIALIVIGLIFLTISGIALKREKAKELKSLSHSITKEIIEESEEPQAINDEEIGDKPIPEEKVEKKKDQDDNKNENKQLESNNENKNPETKEEQKVEEVNQNKDSEQESEDKTSEVKEEQKLEETSQNKVPKAKEEQKLENKLSNIKDETKIVPVVEEEKEIVSEDNSKFIELEKVSEEETDTDSEVNVTKYSEISDEKITEPVKDESIKIKPLKPTQINLVSPKKVKSIEVDISKMQEEEEEEIELL